MRLTLLSILALLASQALAQPDADVIGRLRAGGFVLYLRHTSTDFSQNDARMTSYLDCSAQRNLTDKGARKRGLSANTSGGSRFRSAKS